MSYSKLEVATLPSKGTRHNTLMFSHAMSNIVKSSQLKYSQRNIVVISHFSVKEIHFGHDSHMFSILKSQL